MGSQSAEDRIHDILLARWRHGRAMRRRRAWVFWPGLAAALAASIWLADLIPGKPPDVRIHPSFTLIGLALAARFYGRSGALMALAAVYLAVFFDVWMPPTEPRDWVWFIGNLSSMLGGVLIFTAAPTAAPPPSEKRWRALIRRPDSERCG